MLWRPAKTLWMKSYSNVKIYHFEFLPKRLSELIFSATVKEFLCHKLVFCVNVLKNCLHFEPRSRECGTCQSAVAIETTKFCAL